MKKRSTLEGNTCIMTITFKTNKRSDKAVFIYLY